LTPIAQLSLIPPEEVAKILGFSVVYIYKLAQRGELPSYAFGRAVRFDPHEVSEFIKAHRRRNQR
jgi:excisionase family DNA binding protein